MNTTVPAVNSLWRRKSDGRIDRVAGSDDRNVELFSSETGRSWRIAANGFARKYAPVDAAPNLVGAVLEPANGTQFVAEDPDGDLSLLYRSDESVRSGALRPHAHWFDDDHVLGMDWTEAMAGAARLHALVEIAGPDRPTKDVHTAFGLTYANYLVLPRTLLQSMPEDWQHAFTALLDQLTAAFGHVEQAEACEVTPGTEAYVNELNKAQLQLLGITAEEQGEDSDCPWVYYDRAGEELAEFARVVLPGPDPVPHYNRGRTRIKPRCSAPLTDLN